VNFGERLKEVRLKRGLTLLEIGEKLGRTEATIQRYESGGIKNLKLDAIDELAKILNINPGYLMGWTEKEHLTSDYVFLPTSISAGVPLEVDALTEKDVEKISISDNVMGKWAGNNDIYFTRVNGESMNRVIPHNSLIAVIPVCLEELSDGDIIIYNYDNEFSVKRFYKRDNEIIFRPDTDDMNFTDRVIEINDNVDIVIKGKVVLWIVEGD